MHVGAGAAGRATTSGNTRRMVASSWAACRAATRVSSSVRTSASWTLESQPVSGAPYAARAASRRAGVGAPVGIGVIVGRCSGSTKDDRALNAAYARGYIASWLARLMEWNPSNL